MATLNSWALTTVADVKETLGITSGDSSKNNLIIRKINQATAMIEGYCGKDPNSHFASTTYTDEEYDGSGSNQLVLRNTPVTAVTALKQRQGSQNISGDFDTINSQDYFVDLKAGIIEGYYNYTTRWNSWAVTYTAGYTTIPDDLAEACATLAAYLVENGTTGSSVKSKQQGPKKIEYFENTQNKSLIEDLGLDDVLARYMSYPILADK